MSRLISGDTIDIDDQFQDSVEYTDQKIQWARLEGFCQCDDCNNWFENEAEINAHVCAS